MTREIEFFNEVPSSDCYGDSVSHSLFGYIGLILMANDDDSWYMEEFKTREEAEQFILDFQRLMDKAWPPESIPSSENMGRKPRPSGRL